MIRLILTGGLGNQMFEYAAAKALALELDKKLTIDLYALNKATQGTKRELEIDVFDIDLHISSSWKTKLLVKLFPVVEKNRQLFGKLFGYFRDKSAIVYSSDFESIKGNAILHGHFQNEKYFEKYRVEIRSSFQFNKPLESNNLALANLIKNTTSVGIHIRRGDYLTNNDAKNNFAICSATYYEKAIERIKKEIINPHFFVFSENLDWAKENINFGDSSVEFIDWNEGKNSYIDMQLMSLCQYTIIANSSFSWWVAWLNSNVEKQVYAPAQWFREENRNKDLVNFYPSSWIII